MWRCSECGCRWPNNVTYCPHERVDFPYPCQLIRAERIARASRTHSVSEARRIERVAAAMFNTPDPADPDHIGSQWPPSHPEDLEWWLTRAEAAINTLKEP